MRIIYWDEDEGDTRNEDSETVMAKPCTKESRFAEKLEVTQRKEDLIKLCFNLVVFDGTTNVFRFAHTSVQGYLLEHSDGYFSSEETNHGRVAEHCIALLLQAPNHFGDGPLLQLPDPDWQQIQPDLHYQPQPGHHHLGSDTSYWYFRLPPVAERSLSARAMFWTRKYWAYFVANSGGFRQSSSLKDLEIKLESLVTSQPWRSFRPRLYYSACRYGLISFVEACLKAHPQLIRTQRLPMTTTHRIFETALKEACCGGQREIVDILIDHGADLKLS